MPKKLTNNEFIKKANIKHNNKYDYSKSKYINTKSKICIICPIHGEFYQTPHTHLQGHGCPQCAREKNIIKRSYSNNIFIKKANIKHNFKYAYPKTIYINSYSPIIITCPIHGDFEQLPYHHLQGCGCPKCARENAVKKTSSNNQNFIIKAQKIHKNKTYIYEKTNYINNHTPVIITCPIHGDFEQLPCAHLQGKGCPKCKNSHLEIATETLLKLYNLNYESQKKFDWLVTKKKNRMSLDFYLTEYNTAIECQGIQHYVTKGIFTEEIVHTTKQRDNLKKQLCEKHGIQIYYIKYDDNVEEKIKELLFNLKK